MWESPIGFPKVFSFYFLALESSLLCSLLAVFVCTVDDLFLSFPALLFEESNSVAWAQLHCIYRIREHPKTIAQVFFVELSRKLIFLTVEVPLRHHVAFASPENGCSHRPGVIWADWKCVVGWNRVVFVRFSVLLESEVLTTSKGDRTKLVAFVYVVTLVV